MEVRAHEFDRHFDAVLMPEAEPLQPPPYGGRRLKHALDNETKIRRAMSLFHRGEYQGCIDAMRALAGEAVVDSRIDAFLAASRAIGLGEVGPNLKTCVAAVKKAGPVADVFCALGAVLLGTGDRARAHAVFSKGLAIDPLHPHLRARLRSMGVRKPPVLRSLPRTHAVNRVLGVLRDRLTKS